jgi:hypothetical protein
MARLGEPWRGESRPAGARQGEGALYVATRAARFLIAETFLTPPNRHMAIHLPRSRRDITLLSTSELTRLLNVPESRTQKAIRDGIIKPLGSIGPSVIVGLSEDEIEELRRTLSTPAPRKAANADMP